ncbi:hypothetical protein K474DRAFT_1671959 [Panus rudis PR-1116 ss-1]|nr:hypothetical protein K474DRAFT_1671959 [Panus rudis PR-1116 ss-1]
MGSPVVNGAGWVHYTPPGSSNALADNTGTPSPSPRKAYKTSKQKLDAVLALLGQEQWSLGKLLYMLFRQVDKKGCDVQRSQTHISYLRNFLQGGNEYKPAAIVDMIYTHPYSWPSSPDHPDRDLMFSSTRDPFEDIHYARPSLSTWALSTVSKQLVTESNKIIDHNSGLRVRASRKDTGDGNGAAVTDTQSHGNQGGNVDASVGAGGGGEPGGGSVNLPESLQLTVEQLEEELLLFDPAGEESSSGEDEDEVLDSQGHGQAHSPAAKVSEQETPTSTNIQGAHLGNSTKRRRKRGRRGKTRDPTASWDLISGFSFTAMGELFRTYAPVVYFLLMRFMCPKAPAEDLSEPRDETESTYRPKHVLCTSIISELAYGRNQWVNLLPLCRAISFFSMKAHQSIYRVGTRLGHCTTYATVQNALVLMAKAKRTLLRQQHEIYKWIVLDNIQRYMRPQDHRIGRVDHMVNGCAGTAVELQNCPPGAFDLDPWLTRCSENRREELTVQKLLDNLDWDHLDLISELHFLQILVEYVPVLGDYQQEVERLFSTEARKYQIDPNRHTKVHPLGTNAANETTTSGMKEAVVDFLDQLGIREQQHDDHIQFISGDGKSYEGISNVKKYLSPERHQGPEASRNFKSLQFLLEILELWHTKWTDLGRLCHGKWGVGVEAVDPSTLGFMAKTINNPVPSDKKKPDFYANKRLVEVSNTLRFEKKNANGLPTLAELRDVARSLHHVYANSQAYERALLDQDLLGPLSGSGEKTAHLLPKAASNAHGTSTNSSSSEPAMTPDNLIDEFLREADVEVTHGEDGKKKTTKVARPFCGDWAAANSILLMRDGIWFLEVCRAIQQGDIGCVWEVLKVWIFTFAGSGHPNYTTYLLDMYCKITYELPEATRIALFENWLVNLAGKPGHFLELDLMQEHFNKWLEEMAQHSGKEFDDVWYRDVLSMHVSKTFSSSAAQRVSCCTGCPPRK